MDAAELLNRIINDPDVLPALAPGHTYLDAATPFFARPGNVMLGDERGLALFFPKGRGVYSGHFCYTKALRGRDALLASRNYIAALFTQHAAMSIHGSVPRTNRASRAMARALGFRPVGTSTDTQGRAAINYVLERASWEISLATCSAQAQTSRAATPEQIKP